MEFSRISSFGDLFKYGCVNYLKRSLNNDDGLLILRNTSPQESYYDCYINCWNNNSCYYFTYNCLTSECKLYEIDKASSTFAYFYHPFIYFSDDLIVSQRLITASDFITGIFYKYVEVYWL